MKFTVYKQYTPKEVVGDNHTREYAAQIIPVGEVIATNQDTAIAAAKTWPLFANESKKTLKAWPVVAPAIWLPHER